MMIKVTVSTTFVFLFCWSSSVLGNKNNKNILSDEQIEQFKLAFTRANALAPAPMPKNNTKMPFPCLTGGACRDVIKKYGYSCEEHIVATSDGHILGVQRIPAVQDTTLSNSSKRATAPPVLLQHGLFMDGVGWMLLESDSLAFYLADEGFDVWINNNRGTQYSRCHRWYDTFETPYWDFSWQDLSEIDLDATISYVHNMTGQKVHYVGHSMGSLVALAALASNQSTVEKMRSVALLAPISYLDYITSVFGRVGAELFIPELIDTVQLYEFNPIERIPSLFVAKVCKMFHINCAFDLWFATGPNCCIDSDSFTRFLQFELQPTSTKTLKHFSQIIRRGGLTKFDYGLLGNMIRYKQAKPPVYVLKDIPKNFPIFLGHGATDSLADIVDVLRLIKDLSDHNPDKLVRNFHMFYAHMDFQMAHNALTHVYKPMVSFFNSN